MTSSQRKGSRVERELTNWLDERGWAIIRAPASGSATNRELPDLLVGNGDRVLAIEVKASSGAPIYVDGSKIADLQFFAYHFRAETRIAVKFDVEPGDPAYGVDGQPGFYFLSLEECHVTDGDNYRIKKDIALEEGTPEVDLYEQ